MVYLAQRSVMSKVNWLLKEVMERHRITNRELAIKLGKHETAISRLKLAKTLPAIGGEEVISISDALTELLQARGYDVQVSPKELLSFED